MQEYEGLDEFCTVRQFECLEAIRKHGSITAAAKALGLSRSSVQDAIRFVKRKAARQGHSPEHDMTHLVPDGFSVKGVSTFYNKEGKPAGQWVKSQVDHERQLQIVKDAIAALCEEVPRQEAVRGPAFTLGALCNLIVLTDCHVGMLAWGKESGEDWDLKIAEETLTRCFERLVDSSPSAESCMIAQLGDWLHQDGILPVTPTSGHLLDADGRFSKVVQASVRILRRIVNYALAKHQKVIVLMGEGNHDLSSSIWLRSMFQALYENEPRVSVIDSELPYYVYQHGKTMLAFHHGHLKKNDALPLTFAAQFPEMWGATKKRYCHTGHRHHVEEKEHSGMTVFQHPTLAARDAYAARGGWIAERQISSITYHREFGQVGRIIVTPDMAY